MTYFLAMLSELNEFMRIEHSAQCMAREKCPVKVR